MNLSIENQNLAVQNAKSLNLYDLASGFVRSVVRKSEKNFLDDEAMRAENTLRYESQACLSEGFATSKL